MGTKQDLLAAVDEVSRAVGMLRGDTEDVQAVGAAVEKLKAQISEKIRA